MNLDRNSVIGFVLLALLFFGYFFFNRQAQKDHVAQQKRIEDSLAALKPKADPAAVRIDSLRADSSARVAAAGQFVSASLGTEEITVLENNLLKIGFTNKGGQPAYVQLKKYLSVDSSPVTLAGSKTDKLSYRINTGSTNTAETGDLFFATGKVTQQGVSPSVLYCLIPPEGQSPIPTR
jgi:YidC/Oxa1 family membrane protein insertase